EVERLYLNRANIDTARCTQKESTCGIERMIREANFMRPLIGCPSWQYTHNTRTPSSHRSVDHFVEGTITSECDNPTVALRGRVFRKHHTMPSILCHQRRCVPPFLQNVDNCSGVLLCFRVNDQAGFFLVHRLPPR